VNSDEFQSPAPGQLLDDTRHHCSSAGPAWGAWVLSGARNSEGPAIYPDSSSLSVRAQGAELAIKLGAAGSCKFFTQGVVAVFEARQIPRTYL